MDRVGLKRCAEGMNPLDARIAIYNMVRDIPYAVVPELNSFDRYADILRIRRGSCTPKHLLLCDMYQRLGMTVLYAVHPFRWDELGIDYPSRLRTLARDMPTSNHLACKVDIDGRLVLVDATLDPALKLLGLPVNEDWDGTSDTLPPIEPGGEIQIYHPSEACTLRAQTDERSVAFYHELNSWLDAVRKARRD